MHYQEILRKGINFLKKNNIKNPYLDTELLLSKTLNRKREEILLNVFNKVQIREIKKFKYYLSRRKQKEPIAYILESKEFWSPLNWQKKKVSPWGSAYSVATKNVLRIV